MKFIFLHASKHESSLKVDINTFWVCLARPS